MRSHELESRVLCYWFEISTSFRKFAARLAHAASVGALNLYEPASRHSSTSCGHTSREGRALREPPQTRDSKQPSQKGEPTTVFQSHVAANGQGLRAVRARRGGCSGRTHTSVRSPDADSTMWIASMLPYGILQGLPVRL